MNRILKDIKSAFRLIKSKELEKQKFKFSSLKRLLPYVRKTLEKVIIAFFFMVIVSLLALPTPYLIKYIIDDVIIAKNSRSLNIIILLLINSNFKANIFFSYKLFL
ncbi:hypothetical protein NLC29_00445 [Candidatus Aminicenantes bacterium AH-873-B07]|jgi:ABC-type bacteriocin/lantibiotic exporter with double-glycine peptidase domain|nr:hypothetical protein [Candidatus Aminicenantes bacterium AH-873-B07]